MTAVVALIVTSSASSIYDLPHLTFDDLMMYTNSIIFAYLILDYAVLAPYGHILCAIDRGLLTTLSWLSLLTKSAYHIYNAKTVRVVVCFLVTLVFCLFKLALAYLAWDIVSASRHVARLLLAQVDIPGFLRTLIAPNRFTYSACVFGRAMIATVWAKTTTILMSIQSRLLARLSESWSAPPTAFIFAVNKAKALEKRRTLHLRFSKSKKYTKHGINLSYGNLPSSLDEQFWDAPEDFLGSTEPLTTVKDARLNDDSNGSPGTASPAFGQPAVLGALEIAQSFNMTDFAASPSPCPIAADDKDASPTDTSFEPSLFDQDDFASTSADASPSSSLILPSPASSPASPPAATCEEIKAPSEALPPAPSESPAKSGVLDEPKSEPEPVDKPKSFVKPPPRFKLPVRFNLSQSSARFKLKAAPQPKSLKQLPMQLQLYPRVKLCSRKCDLDVAPLTSLFGQLKLDSFKPGSMAEQTSNATKAPAGKKKAAKRKQFDAVADETKSVKDAAKEKEKARNTKNEKGGVPNVKVPAPSRSARNASGARREPASSDASMTAGASNPARLSESVERAKAPPVSAPPNGPFNGALRKRTFSQTRGSYAIAESGAENNQETLEPQPKK
ncbi:hypothetical protein FRC07_008353 [Ceratobasidium sp. 392]|nr:hypothetical protein FRC07_008353 [Ceratobasidium sp. 392]